MAGLDVLDDAFVEEQYARHGHPIWRFLRRALLLLVAVAIGCAAFVWRYQPLTAGDTYGLRAQPVPLVTTAPDRGSGVVAYSPGGTIDLVFAIGNDGRVPLQVTAVRDALPTLASSYQVRQMPAGTTGYDPDWATKFRAFTLRPGESRTLDLRYTLKDCGPPAGWANRVVRSQRVRYQLYGRLSRWANVPMLTPLVITGAPAC